MTKKEKKIKRGFNWDKYGSAVGIAVLGLFVLLAVAAGWGTGANLPTMWHVAVKVILGIVVGVVVLFFELVITFLILIATDEDYDNPAPELKQFGKDIQTGP